MMVTFEVVIPHVNQRRLLERTLLALSRQGRDVDVCVIDNASRDDTVAVLERSYPQVRLVKMTRNVGFGKACNAGVATSAADYVVLLNNDTIPHDDFVASIERSIAAAGDPEMLSAALIHPDGFVDSYGVRLDSNFNALDVGRGLAPESLAALAPPAPFAPTGGAAVFQRDAFMAIGGFDERIFAYLEDVDLGLRLHLAGARWAGAPDARVVHAHSATLGSGSYRKNYLLAKNKVYLLHKYRPALKRSTAVRALLSEGIISIAKTARDGNAGSLRGMASGCVMRRIEAIESDSGGSVYDVIETASFADGLRARQDARRVVRHGDGAEIGEAGHQHP